MGQIRQKPSRDDRQMLAFMLVIACYLVVALALPLYAILSKSFKTRMESLLVSVTILSISIPRH